MEADKSCCRLLPALLLILLAGILVYANTFQVPFILDDGITIIKDTFVHNLDNFRPGAIENMMEHPRWFSYLTFALNYHFGGLEVAGYHLTNLLIHLMVALLVYALLRLTFLTPYFEAHDSELKEQPEEQSPLFSSLISYSCFVPLFAALVFVAHPVQTQAVTYIVQRVTSLATMLYLLSMVLYVQARLDIEKSGGKIHSSGAGVRVKSGLLITGSFFVAVIAMRTKEIAFTLPLAAVLYEVFFFRGAWKRRLLYLLPLLATMPIVPLSVLAIGEATGHSTGDLLTDVSQQTLVHGKLSNVDYLFTQFRVIVTYLRLLVLPVNQNLDYDYPVYTTFFTPPVFLSFLLLAAIFALAVYLFWRTRWVGLPTPAPTVQPEPQRHPVSIAPRPAFRLVAFGIFWFFLTLSVESSLISIADVIVEHRLYLPGFGAATAFAAVLYLLAGKIAPPARGKLLVLVAASLVLLMGYATCQRNQVWGDAIRLWQDVVAKSPNKVRPYNNLGVALTEAGRLPEATKMFTRAIALDPMHPHAYNNLGRIYILSGQSRAALPLLRTAIRLDLDYDDAYINLAAALNQERRFRETIDLLEQNLGFLGERVEAHYHLGVAYAFLGNREAAQRKLAIVSREDAVLAADLIRLLGRGGQ